MTTTIPNTWYRWSHHVENSQITYNKNVLPFYAMLSLSLCFPLHDVILKFNLYFFEIWKRECSQLFFWENGNVLKMQGQMKPEGHLEGDLYDLFPGWFLVFYLTFCS